MLPGQAANELAQFEHKTRSVRFGLAPCGQALRGLHRRGGEALEHPHLGLGPEHDLLIRSQDQGLGAGHVVRLGADVSLAGDRCSSAGPAGLWRPRRPRQIKPRPMPCPLGGPCRRSSLGNG